MKISVIIPSRNRLTSVTECLISLSRQRVMPDEILVIENGAGQNYLSLKNKFKNMPLKLYLEKRPGKSWARNKGIKEAKGDIVVFLDDDCESNPNWLSEIVKAFRQNPDIDVVLGKSEELSESTLIKAYTFQYERWFLDLRVNQKTGRVICGGALNSRNFAIKRSFITKNNLIFRREYDRFGFAEDTDLGERLEKLGARMKYCGKALVVHKENNSLTGLLRKKFTNGRAMYLLSQKIIFHTFQKQKKGMVHKIKRVLSVTKNFSLVQKPLFITYLYLIVSSYHLGFIYEKIVSRKSNK